ncbi:MAG: right-handed parallel beta-helix repeat-containing protein [Deltaproteobacteria bacterium]|nr:right-handed parallel beta-helix repeat-containing protein [Deltaproteobacteria bacterium]
MNSKNIYLHIVLLLLVSNVHADSSDVTERLIRISSDSHRSGTLRTVLRIACDDEGDDIIKLESTVGRVMLEEPLVIPHDCVGTITLKGSFVKETILDASLIFAGSDVPGDTCALHVYSDNNTIQGITFVNNALGAGVCLFGRGNLVKQNKFGVLKNKTKEPNLYGVVVSDIFSADYPAMDATLNEIRQNTISHNTLHGIFIEAKDTQIRKNVIEHNGTCHNIEEPDDWIEGLLESDANRPVFIAPASSGSVGLKSNGKVTSKGKSNGGLSFNKPAKGASNSDKKTKSKKVFSKPLIKGAPADDTYDIKTQGGAGIFIASESANATVGGDLFNNDKNTIRYNCYAGVAVEEDELNSLNTITHNVITGNGTNNADLDLGVDGLTLNDFEDEDTGANNLLNFVDHTQVFPLVPAPDGMDRYWVWGISLGGDRLEFYKATGDVADRGISNGGAEDYIDDVAVVDSTVELEDADLAFGDIITSLSFDAEGNTSEFAQNVYVGRDTDLDGILDIFETGDGSFASRGTDPQNPDSDGDGLADGLEDKNRNGVFERDLGETCAYNNDTDGDGVLDLNEWHSGLMLSGIQVVSALGSDSDGDGLTDGEEDVNHNGIWDGYLGETSPLLIDSDGDGYNDAEDRCPMLDYYDQHFPRCDQ